MIQAVRKGIISKQDHLLNQDSDCREAYMRRVRGQQSKKIPHKIQAFQSWPGAISWPGHWVHGSRKGGSQT
jgi:hypothetical protein